MCVVKTVIGAKVTGIIKVMSNAYESSLKQEKNERDRDRERQEENEEDRKGGEDQKQGGKCLLVFVLKPWATQYLESLGQKVYRLNIL